MIRLLSYNGFVLKKKKCFMYKLFKKPLRKPKCFFYRKRQPKSPTKVGLPQPNIKKSSLPLPKAGNKAVVGSASPSPEPLGTSNTISSSGRSSLSPERNNNNNSNDKYQIRPGTYKKSETTPCSDFMDENPTREDIISMVEKDVAFSSLDNRRLLMAFIKKICQAS